MREPIRKLEHAEKTVHKPVRLVVAALILAWILAIGAGGTSFGGRALIVLLASIFAGVVYVLPYWNWYHFPLAYILGDISGWVVSWGIGGLAMAKIVKA